MDITPYKLRESNCDHKVITETEKSKVKCENILTKTGIKLLPNFGTLTSNFYGMPKIYKSELLLK